MQLWHLSCIHNTALRYYSCTHQGLPLRNWKCWQHPRVDGKVNPYVNHMPITSNILSFHTFRSCLRQRQHSRSEEIMILILHILYCIFWFIVYVYNHAYIYISYIYIFIYLYIYIYIYIRTYIMYQQIQNAQSWISFDWMLPISRTPRSKHDLSVRFAWHHLSLLQHFANLTKTNPMEIWRVTVLEY